MHSLTWPFLFVVITTAEIHSVGESTFRINEISDSLSNSCFRGSLKTIGTLRVVSWTGWTFWSISRWSCPSSLHSPVNASLYCDKSSTLGPSLLKPSESPSWIFCLLTVRNLRCSLALKPKMDLHAPLTIRNSMLYLLSFFGLTNFSLFLPKGLTSDWFYITRVIVVFSNSLKLLCPQSLVTVSAVIMFTVDPLSN